LLFKMVWDGAGRAFEQALNLNPNHTTTIHGYADYLTLTGRPEEGLAQVRRAARIDPHSPMSNLPVPFHLYLMQHYDEALNELQKLQDKSPDYPVHHHLMLVLWQLGRREESLTAYRKFLLANGDNILLESLERGYASAGPEGALRAVADAMAERFEARYVEPFQIASLYAQTGDTGLAFEWLEKALELGSVQLIYVGVRPEFEALNADPRYVEWLHDLGIAIPQAGPAS
jgi:tetratricopeptide (TPR) repeat protein